MKPERKRILDKVLDLTHRERVLKQVRAQMEVDKTDRNVIDSVLKEIARVNKEFERLESELHGSEAI